MAANLHPLSLSRPMLPAVAEWLLTHATGPEPEDLADALVLLPSHRAGEQLRHALLEAAGGATLLLPWITTPTRLAAELAELQGLSDDSLPDPALRPLLLAPPLARQPWLQERPEAAAGLAAELVTLFDDVRRAGCGAAVLDGQDDDALLGLAEAGGEEVLLVDLEHIREGWRLFRQILPRDQVDIQLEALAGAGRSWPGRAPRLLAAAHLGRLDGCVRRLLETLAVPLHWLAPSADTPRSRLLLATYREPTSATHPLAEAGRLTEDLTGAALPVPVFAADNLPSRLADLGAARAEFGPEGPVSLQICRDAEHEARVVAARVCETLAAADTAPDIIVASPDRDLAARITAHLRDAGVDVDDTGGRPLLNLPAGRLLRDLLRVVVAGWPFGPVFEVLTHPYVWLTPSEARPSHPVRVQILEARIRRTGQARAGRAALQHLAGVEDERRGDKVISGFVHELTAALAPLDALTGGPINWSEALAAVRTVWSAVAPSRALDGDADPHGDHDDIGAVDQLLQTLEAAVAHLEPCLLADAAAVILDQLRTTEVRPRRQRHLPVRVMGLVEARLEQAEHLLLAGLSQDVFPGRLPRPLFLPDRVRRHFGLANWREKAGRDAELFLRLLHTAPRLTITWPTTIDGRDSLPSPLVQRLSMVTPEPPTPAGEPHAYRRELPDLATVVAAERRHQAEPEPVPAPSVAPPASLSHTAMQRYRDCPYLFLMANAHGLRRPEALEAEFTPMDHGNLAHKVMENWLTPGGAGVRALAAADRSAATESLHDALRRTGDEGHDDLPGAAVARRSLLALADDLVDHELTRHQSWRPAVLEARFSITLDDVHRWLTDRGEQPAAVPTDQGSYALTGAIDRVDVARDGTLAAVVIDYKTGTPPSKARVSQGRELQLAMYALAVEAGDVEGLDPLDHGWRLAEGGFYTLRRRGLGFGAFLDAGDDLTAGVATIYQQALAILDRDEPYALVPHWRDDDAGGQLPCQHCEFRGICRLEERDTTAALAARVAALLSASPRSWS